MLRSLVVLVLVWSIPILASADVPPPGLDECSGREVGDPCSVEGEDGACQDSSCGRLDYSQGTPPRSVSYPCVLCVPGATPTNAPPAAGCSIGAGAPSGWLIALGAIVLVARRRRRSRRQ